MISSDPGLARRIARVRREAFGEHGGPLLARRLDLPFDIWAGFQAGRPIPAEVVLGLVNLLGLEARWLLTGSGEPYRDATGPGAAAG